MGYSTSFEGEILITPELMASHIKHIEQTIDRLEDDNSKDYHPDYEFNKDYTGLIWNGAEKSRGMDEAIKDIIAATTNLYPEIKFNGQLKAQGEEYDDRWILRVVDNLVDTEDLILTGKEVICPECKYKFRLED